MKAITDISNPVAYDVIKFKMLSATI